MRYQRVGGVTSHWWVYWGADAPGVRTHAAAVPERGVDASFAAVCSSWFLWFAPVFNRKILLLVQQGAEPVDWTVH